MDVFVLHDAAGKIVAVGHCNPKSTRRVDVSASGKNHVLRVTVNEADLSTLSNLHQTHEVDVARGALSKCK
jgi:hypothetical protein